jgi:predicted transposase/invertase (TIGR01784 family)
VERWTYFFKYAEETSDNMLERITGDDKGIARAYSELNRFSWSEEELRTYDQAEKYESAYIASMDQKFDEGMEKGEMKSRKEIAQKMLGKGMSLQDVSNLTGVPLVNLD